MDVRARVCFGVGDFSKPSRALRLVGLVVFESADFGCLLLAGSGASIGGTEDDARGLEMDDMLDEGFPVPVEIGRDKATRSGAKSRRSILFFCVSPNAPPGRKLEPMV